MPTFFIQVIQSSPEAFRDIVALILLLLFFTSVFLLIVPNFRLSGTEYSLNNKQRIYFALLAIFIFVLFCLFVVKVSEPKSNRTGENITPQQPRTNLEYKPGTTKNSITILKGQPGGTFEKLSEKFKEFLGSESELEGKYDISLTETGGSIDNCIRLQKKSGANNTTLGLMQLAAHKGYNNCNIANLQYIIPVYNEVMHFAVRQKTYTALSKKYSPEEITPCLFQDIGLPIFIGLDKSSTNKIAQNYLNSNCNPASKNSVINNNLTFDKGKDELRKDDGIVKAGFFSQAAKSKLLIDMVQEDQVCFLKLDETSLIKIKNDLTLYSASEKTKEFYSDHICNKTTDLFKSVSSVTVLATNKEENIDPKIIDKILSSIYDKKGEPNGKLKEFAPEFLTFSETCKKIGIKLTESGTYDITPTKETKEFYSKENCK